jgi:alpha-L-rhamnosidase
VRGKAGTQVTLRHAETLRPDGSLYLDNLRGARVTDTYILNGRGSELYEPRFTYHGFRYVELRGFPGRPDADTLTACVVHDDLEPAGEWSCSQPLLNRLYENIRWGVRGNYRSLPTDCPQRDERQGWLGDRSEGAKGEAFLFRTAPLYSKWIQDMADAQREDGSVPDVCPPYWPIYSDNVTWPGSAVTIPGHLLVQFGDSAVIERHYPGMRRWVEHMASFIQEDLMPRDNYGDWCVPPEDPKLIHSQDPLRQTHPTILGTTGFVHCLRLLAGYAERLGKADDARRYRDLAGRLRTALNAKFYDAAKGYYDNGSQTSCVLPLALGLAPEGQQERLFDHLVGKITGETRSHIGTGLVGGQWLLRTLSDHGRADLAYTLATNRTYPSWGYMIDQGATTIWELWNGNTADPAMNSGNHVMLVGDLLIWMYERLAGIQSDPVRPGFKHIVMRPTPVGDLTQVKATHRSPYGLIASEWRVERDPVPRDTRTLEKHGLIGSGIVFSTFRWEVTVPPNTSATLHLPTGPRGSITEGGKPAAEATGLKSLGLEGGWASFEAAPGRYSFESR